MKIIYSHLLRFLKTKPSIENVSEKLFQLGHENEIDQDILDIEFTPNRGDCLSVRGLARDLGTFYGFEDTLERYDDELNDYNFCFTNKNQVKCPYISFLKFEVKNISRIYKDYLESYFQNLKINKNNFFADVSNYVAYELGQPTHCYDLDKMSESLTFETLIDSGSFETLLEQKINLNGENCVFSNNGKVMSLAGVMGGMESACSIDTNKVLVECAFFQPESIIGKSVKYNLQSEAAHKFERGVDPYHQEDVLRRFIKVVSDHSEIINIQYVKFEKEPPNLKEIVVDFKKIRSVIGNDLKEDEIKDILDSIGIKINKNVARIPSYRHDISSNNDLTEEVARIIGYDNLNRIPFTINAEKKFTDSSEAALKNYLVANGFNEVINIPFIGYKSKNSIKVDNPLDSNREFMRTQISDSLIENLFYNEKRQKDSIKLFEISDIYYLKEELSIKKNISLLVSGRKDKNYQDFSKSLDIKYLKSLFSEIGYDLKDNEIKMLDRNQYDSKIKTKVYIIEIELSELIKNFTKKERSKPIDFSNCIQYEKISEFPLINRDLSFQLPDENNLTKLERQLLKYKTQNLSEVFVFDYYKNKELGFIKIGFRFIFQSKDKTLTDAIVDAEIKDIVNSVMNIENISIPGYEH